MSTVYRRIFTIIIAIHQQIVCTSLIYADNQFASMDQLLIGYTNIYGHESTINTQRIGTYVLALRVLVGIMQYNIRSNSITWVRCIR